MKKLSLNAKFLFVLSIFVVASIAISVIGIMKLADLNQSLDTLVNVNAARVVHAKSIMADLNDVRNREKVYILEETAEGMESVGKVLDGLEDSLRKELDEYEKLADEVGKKEIEESRKLLEKWLPISQELRKHAQAGRNAEAIALARGKSKETLEQFSTIMEKLVKRNVEFMDKASKEAQEMYESSRLTIIVVSLSAILAGLFLAFVILRAVNNAITQVINNLNDNSNQVTSAAGQIASSSEELSQAATEQAASLQETSSAVEEMSSMIRKNADGAKQGAESSQGSSEAAEKGKLVVEQMINAMSEINQANTDIMNQINDSNQKISEIVKVISEIGNKTKVINEIVFQTKLLSFNASVEAARAGEHGKGFAVVAEEVGNLAQMSGNAAKEISEMLEGSIHKVEGIVHETKTKVESLVAHGRAKVDLGSNVARQCGDVLEEIVGSVNNVGTLVNDISTASHEQAKGIEEITRAMSQLDQVTQQNASVSQEAASAAEELSAQAQSLKSVVQTLILTIKGESKSGTAMVHNAPERTARTSVTRPKPETSQVIALANRKQAKMKVRGSGSDGVKIAVGSDLVPSEDDPRFKDV